MSIQNNAYFSEKLRMKTEQENKAKEAAAAQVQQTPSPTVMPASNVPVPSPAIPVFATPLPSPCVTPQSTAQSTGSGSLPATPYETPRSSRCRKY